MTALFATLFTAFHRLDFSALATWFSFPGDRLYLGGAGGFLSLYSHLADGIMQAIL